MTNAAAKSLIDCHVHLAALPDGENGCHISPKMLKSPLFRFLFWKHGLSVDRPREANEKYLADLLVELRASRHVQKAVLLGMDGHYDSSGALSLEHTDLLVSNDYVLKAARAHPDESTTPNANVRIPGESFTRSPRDPGRPPEEPARS